MTKLTQTGSQASQQLSRSLCRELSKQLCELCGVKLEFIINDNLDIGDQSFFYKNKNEACEELMKQENWGKRETLDYIKLKGKDGVINFGHPENFVKLLNIKTELEDYSPTLFNFITNYYHEKYATVEENYLYSLICLLTDSLIHKDYLRPAKWKNIVKQSIREAEWKYE